MSNVDKDLENKILGDAQEFSKLPLEELARRIALYPKSQRGKWVVEARIPWSMIYALRIKLQTNL